MELSISSASYDCLLANGHMRVVSYILVIDIKNERRDPDRKQV